MMNSVSNAQNYTFAKFDLSNWPLVIVKCDELKSNDDFDFFYKIGKLGVSNKIIA